MKPYWQSSTRGINQIWLQVREDSRNLLYYFNLLEPILYKYGDFRKQIPPKLVTFGCIFFTKILWSELHKKRLMNVSLFFFFFIFFRLALPTKAPRQGYCVYIHYRVYR